MEASAAPETALNPLIRIERDFTGSISSSAEIESSQQISDVENNNSHHHRQKRAFIVTSSSTLTITSFSISTTVSTKVVILGRLADGAACAACVECLPSGISICKWNTNFEIKPKKPSSFKWQHNSLFKKNIILSYRLCYFIISFKYYTCIVVLSIYKRF